MIDKFTNRPECPKCLDQRFDWAWHRNDACAGPNMPSTDLPVGSGEIGDHLHLSCVRCGHQIVMATKDAR